MNDMPKVPDQDLMKAEDGRLHTRECVEHGWWLLDWDVDCLHVGVPKGGGTAALAERALFTTALVLLPVATGVVRVVEAVRRGR